VYHRKKNRQGHNERGTTADTTHGRKLAMKARVVRRWKKLVLSRVARLGAALPLVVVLALPLLARSRHLAHVPALEPLGKQAGERAAAAIVGAVRTERAP